MNGIANKQYNTVDYYDKYLIFRNNSSHSEPIENNDNIEICDLNKDNIKQSENIIEYFKDILIQSGEMSFDIQSEEQENMNPNQISSKILLYALDNIDQKKPKSALTNYINGVNPSLPSYKKNLIYPFGCNESQKLAVESSFANSISIIEGPPGTGKTQTILNIIANLIVQNKTVAIVSNNNSAVLNVYEKLQKYGYGMVVAPLGKKENIDSFFNNIEEQIPDSNFELSEEMLEEEYNIIKDLDNTTTQCFQYRNQLAKLKTQLSDSEIEYHHIQSEQKISSEFIAVLDKKFYRKWSYKKVLQLRNMLPNTQLNTRKSIINKLQLIFQFGLFDLRILNNYSDELNTYLNHKFYELYIAKIKEEILSIEKWLESNNEVTNLKQFVASSKKAFNATLYEKYKHNRSEKFTATNYRLQFNDFVKYYPVILSSTVSLKNCTPNNYLYDYLIIDESSQVDIIKSAVCFSCSKNVVIVGDSMQLTHIVDAKSKQITEQLQLKYQIHPAYNYVEQNILNSLKSLYGDKVNSVLLKEHYRCHPTIIGFCNKKYYDNNLVIMTSGENQPFKIIETSISGVRGKSNQRQIDETGLYIKENYSTDYTKVGVIAPYRDHADLLKKELPEGTEADTIHKYQGREKDTIIFNTVSAGINPFIDNPNLINVAVSRAIKEFIVVKPEAMEIPHGTNIGDLLRYMHYTTDPEDTIVKGKICSVFDLLYKEYNAEFATFIQSNKNIEGSAAEIIIHKLLADEILQPNSQFSTIDMIREYKLRDLIKALSLFTEEEITFIKNNARLDFLLFNKIDKTPILAIEVDGVSFHDNEVQQERDSKKNKILDKIGLPLLRLSTNGHNERERIICSLVTAMSESQASSNDSL
ncbi:MAG: AAA domain-containing protein [Tannerellaceae bacterium]